MPRVRFPLPAPDRLSVGLFGDSKPKRAPAIAGPAPAGAPVPAGIQAPQLKSPSTILGVGLQVAGEMTSDEDIVIEGRFSGKLTSSARISVGRNGVVEADLNADIIQISGRVKGNLTARQKIELVAGGYLEGNIQTPKVVVAEGAVFKGNVDMTMPTEPSAAGGGAAPASAPTPVRSAK